VALLMAALLMLLGVPAMADAPPAGADAPASTTFSAPAPAPVDEGAPPPRVGSTLRSAFAESAGGQAPFVHPSTVGCGAPVAAAVGEKTADAGPRARTSRALFLVLCTLLN
jgi:hypothetical protein